MSRQRLCERILDRLVNAGGQLDKLTLYCGFYNSGKEEIEKALRTLRAANSMSIDFGLITLNSELK